MRDEAPHGLQQILQRLVCAVPVVVVQADKHLVEEVRNGVTVPLDGRNAGDRVAQSRLPEERREVRPDGLQAGGDEILLLENAEAVGGGHAHVVRWRDARLAVDLGRHEPLPDQVRTVVHHDLVFLGVAGVEEGELADAQGVRLTLQDELAARGAEGAGFLHTDDWGASEGAPRDAPGVAVLQQPHLVGLAVGVLELELISCNVPHYFV